MTGKREKESGNFTEPIFGVRLQALVITVRREKGLKVCRQVAGLKGGKGERARG